IFDPSHSTGRRETVIPMARAAVAVGADGLLVDVHPYPERALCDGPQALLFDMFRRMVDEVRAISAIVRHSAA
ncbi:MAG: 3-deoxy-7-phosphoheptulonate synthase, partial [Blastocatellia bacterium]|nr:3-deoxy-7-phosphoheptulonate synthase [Blastocatellia bacterium]